MNINFNFLNLMGIDRPPAVSISDLLRVNKRTERALTTNSKKHRQERKRRKMQRRTGH